MSNSPGSSRWSPGATMSPPSNSRDGRAYEMASCFRAPLTPDSTSSSLLTAIFSFSRIFIHPSSFLYRAEVIVHGRKAMVEVFKRAGLNYVFGFPGTEWPPVWEAFAEAKERGQGSLNEVEKEGFFAEIAKRYPAT